MRTFSVKHSEHDLLILLYPFVFFIISHFISKFIFISFSSHIYLESSVSFAYSRCLNDLVWLRYLSLNFSLAPIYVFSIGGLGLGVAPGVLVVVTWAL